MLVCRHCSNIRASHTGEGTRGRVGTEAIQNGHKLRKELICVHFTYQWNGGKFARRLSGIYKFIRILEYNKNGIVVPIVLVWRHTFTHLLLA